MILTKKHRDAAALGVAVVDTPDNLTIFREPACPAAIWHRHTDPGLQSWIDGLNPEHLPRGRIVLPLDNVRPALEHLCDMAETPAGPERDQLVDDITALSRIFAELMQVTHLRLRLDAVTTNACRKFHVDAIAARLICTYRGIGTQYGIGAPGQDPNRVFTVPTGAPVLLRGTLWPPVPASGLRHRSPPIEGTEETRLVLVLDPVLELDGEI